ncbi:hypothetical protein D6779_05905, partial [Candidatus Parcubacteria bacterium]
VKERVQSGWRWLRRKVPKYVWEKVQAGWDFITKRVPNWVRERVQVGWKAVSGQAAFPPSRAETPASSSAATPTPPPGPQSIPEPENSSQSTPVLSVTPIQIASDKPSLWQRLKDLWHTRHVRIRLIAAAAILLVPPMYFAANLLARPFADTSPLAWWGVGSENRGVNTALANHSTIMDVVRNYNAAIASGTVFACEYNQQGEARKECVRSVEISPILVEAAISVQSQWKIPWWDSSVMRWLQGQEHSSEGIAQVSQPELEQWADNLKEYLPPGASLAPQDAHASAGAVIERIAPVLEYCRQRNCDANSQVIVAAMAQNGRGFITDTLQEEIYKAPRYLNSDGSVNWEKYFEEQGPRPYEGGTINLISRFVQNLRAVPGNFERQFMLQLYVNDLKALQARGETLPEGVDLEYLECLADRLPGANYHCGSEKDD